MNSSNKPTAEERATPSEWPDRTVLANYEKLLVRWMRLGLVTPGILGVVLCFVAATLFIADADYREHEAVLVVMFGAGALLVLGAAAVATWRPNGFSTYLKTHAALLDAGAAEIQKHSVAQGDHSPSDDSPGQAPPS